MNSGEISQRQEKARNLLTDRELDAFVLASSENIRYLSGVTEPSVHSCSVLIIPRQSEPTLTVLWLDEEAAQEQVEGVNVVTYTPQSFGLTVTNLIKQLNIEKISLGMDPRALTRLSDSFRRSLPQATLQNASKTVTELRWVKSLGEIQMMRKACEIADQGMRAAQESLRPGVTELHVAAQAEHAMLELGSEPIKHRTIVGSGRRAGLVHPFATDKKIDEGEMVAIDLGAVYQGYCSDLARTFFTSGVGGEIESDYESMRVIEENIMKKMRRGVPIKELEAFANVVAKENGRQLIGHLGHSIGLEVEEQPDLGFVVGPTIDAKLEANMLVALIQSSLKSNNSLGIRLEDTMLVTESGVETLTRYPK